MNPSSLFNSRGNAHSSAPQNSIFDLVANSEKVVTEMVEGPVVEGIEDLELSDAMRTVSRVLRRAAEDKAAAEAEAAEWKHKYEVERERNMHLEQKDVAYSEHNEGNKQKVGDYKEHPEISQRCCGENGICSHEVLRDCREENSVNCKPTKKASFKLQWCSSNDDNDQHKHDIVSFEKGHITTAERSSKQISLKWESPPQTVLIMTKPNSASVKILCAEMVRWLKEKRKLNIYVEPRVRNELLTESSYYNFAHTWNDGKDNWRYKLCWSILSI